jgi:hypothetical protein
VFNRATELQATLVSALPAISAVSCSSLKANYRMYHGIHVALKHVPGLPRCHLDAMQAHTREHAISLDAAWYCCQL